MADSKDNDLLRQYAEHESDAAFHELVERHVNFVYSVAMRYVGNPAEAQEVAQAVFVILARKSAGLCNRKTLAGWLYETTRLSCRQLLRTKARRLEREQEAYMRTSLEQPDGEPLWPQLATHLENAMSQLSASDRELLALRFYENKTGEEAAALLGIGAAAAHKRTKRALDKLQKFFAAHGVTSTTDAIATVVSANAMPAAPAALAKTVSLVAIAKGATASTSTSTLIKGALKIMAWTKATTAVAVGIGILLAVGITTVGGKNVYSGEPGYHGKSLTAWLEGSKNLVFTRDSETGAERRQKDAELQMTYDAVRHIGRRAIPTLLKWVANPTNGGGHILAAGCIQKLGPDAKYAVPGLIKILDSENWVERYASFNVLQRIGPAADPALPAVLDHIQHDPADNMRSFAVTTLANSGMGKQKPEIVVPILIECLAPTNVPINLGDTFRALAGLGANAKSSVPAILPYLNDPDPEVRKAAQSAISQIDPDAATRN